MIRFHGMSEADDAALRNDLGLNAEKAAGPVVHVVPANKLEDFRGIVESPALLFVLKGGKPSEFDEWCEDFEAQLLADSEEDCEFLRRLSHCGRVLEWREAVDLIPANWFNAIAGFRSHPSVRDLIERGPLREEQREHLGGCAACRAEIEEALKTRSFWMQQLHCPSVRAIGRWLESKSGEADVENHLRQCPKCRSSLESQAWLWFGANLLSDEQCRLKLALIGFVKSDEPWLVLMAQGLKREFATHAQAASWLCELIQKTVAPELMTIFGRGTPITHKDDQRTLVLTADDFEKVLSSGPGFQNFKGSSHWLSVQTTPSAIKLLIGTAPGKRATCFSLRFSRQTEDDSYELVHQVKSDTSGVLSLTLQDFAKLRHIALHRLEIAIEEEATKPF